MQQDAVLLTVTADAPVEQYQLFLHDDDAAMVCLLERVHSGVVAGDSRST